MDNVDTQDVAVDNVDTQDAGSVDTSAVDAGIIEQNSFNWKNNLPSDLANSPFIKDDRFTNDEVGLSKMVESYGNLEKLLGHEKVPIPKGPEDAEGWNRFSKAMGIPDKAEGYGLSDVNMPEGLGDMTLEKARFAEIAHAHKLTPSQAKGLWETYNSVGQEAYNKVLQDQEKQLDTTINELRGQWGDEYDVNVELGQMVINKFSEDQEMNDFITQQLGRSSKGIKFLAKLGDQFAENKMGDFQMKRFSLGPENAQNEIDKIMANPNHAYHNPSATPKDHQAAIDYVNSLYAAINRGRG